VSEHNPLGWSKDIEEKKDGYGTVARAFFSESRHGVDASGDHRGRGVELAQPSVSFF